MDQGAVHKESKRSIDNTVMYISQENNEGPNVIPLFVAVVVIIFVISLTFVVL